MTLLYCPKRKKEGLGINAKKTKYLTYNINESEALKTSEGTEIGEKRRL